MSLEPAVVEQLRLTLARVERDENCLICLAVEGGSRARGSDPSDGHYDVRFVYVRPWASYLSTSLEERPDVIELPVSPELTVSGSDLRETLRLLQTSDPALIEWLRSPLVYYERAAIADGLRRLATQFSEPNAAAGPNPRALDGFFLGALLDAWGPMPG